MPDYASSPASFISVRPPEAAPYAPPNMAGPLMQAFGGIPDQYFAGKQMQQQLQQMQPVIDPATGKVVDPNDPRAIGLIQKAVLERGGLGAAAGLIPQLFKQQVLNSPTAPAELPAGTQTTTPGRGVPGVTGPAGIVANYTGEGDTKGGDTLNTLATGMAGGRDVSRVIQRVANAMRIDPDKDVLSGKDLETAKNYLSRGISGGTGRLPPESPVASVGQEGETARGPSSATDARHNTPSSTPIAAGSAVSGAPAPQTNAPGTTMPASGIRPSGPNPASVLVPPDYRNGRELEYARMLRGLADQDRQQAHKEGVVGVPSKALEDRAAARDKKAEQVETALGTYAQEQAKVPIKGQEEIQKQDIDRSGAKYSGIAAKAETYAKEQKGGIDLTRSILNTPGVYTGAGVNISMAINRARALLGDANAAALQEAIQKITAQNVLAQINSQRFDLQEAGEKSSRIFSQQVDQVSKSSVALENTVRGNLFLANVQDRMGALNNVMLSMAAAYRRSHGGVLDDGWDEQVANYMRQHPVFTTEEQQHPEYLAAPSPPPGLNAQKMREWERAMGLSSGEVISVADPRQEGSRIYKRIPPEKT